MCLLCTTTYFYWQGFYVFYVAKVVSYYGEFDFSNRGGKIDRRFCRDRDIENHEPYIVDYSNSRFYGSSNKTLLLVPLDFDDTFKQTVVPYLDLKKAPLSKDPLKDGITNIRINESGSCVESDVQNDENTTEDESDLINNTENTGRIISEVNFRDYAVPQYTPITATSTAQSGYAFNLGGYLDAYGLTEVSEPQFLRNDNNEIVYGVKFENGIMLGLYFYNLEALDPYYGNGSNYELTKVLVTACKPDFVFMDYDELKNAGTKKVKKLASWSREFNFHDRNGKIFEDLYTDFHLPYKVPKDSPRIHSDECDTLYVPLDFDDTFKQTVAPYLDLKKAPLSKDPFGDKN